MAESSRTRYLLPSSTRLARGRRARDRNRQRLVLEPLEERVHLTVNPGVVLVGPTPPTDPTTGLPLNMSWGQQGDSGITNTPLLNSNGAVAGIYQQPGTNGLAAPPANTNVPYTPNGSDLFNQSVQSSDWWSNLMFRIDPTTVGGATYRYSNQFLFSDPAVLRFTDNQFQASTSDWVQGLSIFNPDTFGITPTPQGPATTTNRGFYVNQVSPLTVGIGSGKRVAQGVADPGIAPLIDPKALTGTPTNPNGPDESQLMVRINHYSDWGVQAVYGDGQTPQAANDPSSEANTLTVDMANGSPFIDFTKKGTAPADVWLTPIGPGASNQIWGRDIAGLALPPNMLGVTSTVNWTDSSGVNHQNVSSYLVIAQAGSWQLAPGYNPVASQNQLFVNSGITNGKIAVVLLPHMVGQTAFSALPTADQLAIAQMFYLAPANDPTASPVALNFAANNSSSTRVSDPSFHQEVYDGQTVNFGYDSATSLVTTKYTVATDNGQPTDEILYPHQYENLLPGDQQNLLTYDLNGVPQPLEYLTLSGTTKLYSSPTNTFATQLPYSGILPYLPSTVAQTDPNAAEALYLDAAQWFNAYLQAPGSVISPTDNTYEVGLTLLSQQLVIIDQLAAPTSLLSPQERSTAASWLNRLLQDLESTLFSWFDASTGRVFQLNTTFDTVIGYPAGFGSDFSINDHNFHYGYFLSAFAAVAQFDPQFVTALVPQITYLVDDVANWSRNDPNLPFLREFNPWEGHSWADGLGQGGENMESIAESLQFDSGLAQLGMVLGNAQWRDVGVFMYSSEIEAEDQYWFNTGADPSQGDFGNWPQEFVQYNLNSTPTSVTQVANPRQSGPNRETFFSSPNYAEAIYAINWLPISAQSLYLGQDQAYLEANWAQFIQDYNAQTPVNQGVYELLVAAYQALLPDSGTGVDQPGPSNALLRIDPSYNPAIIPPAPDNIVNNGYLGTTRTQALNWIDTLRQLGQVDPTVVADGPSYAAFTRDGARSFVAYNPTGQTTEVTFRDRQSGTVLATLTLQPGEMVTRLASGQLITDRLTDYQVPDQGTSLYLLSGGGQNTLGAQPGNAVPNPNGNPLDINTYSSTFADVPANPNGTDSFPGNPYSLTFISGPINGTPIAGDTTQFQLFLDNALTWANAPAPDPTYGRQYGPGIVQNTYLNTPNFNVEISYQFDDSSDPTGSRATFTDRVEWYTAKLTPNNQFVLYDTTVADPSVSFSSLFNRANLANQPFQPMVDGRVKIQIWGGSVQSGLTPKDFAISVNTVEQMARTSRLILPYTLTDSNGNASAPLTVAGVQAVTPVLRSKPVDSVTVNLSGDAGDGGFGTSALGLTVNGVGLLIGSGVTIVPMGGGTYQINGLGALQTDSGDYVLTINASQIFNPAGKAGSGTYSVDWVLDQAPPTASLATTATNPAQSTPIQITVLFSKPVSGFTAAGVQVGGAVLSNFTGSGSVYAFDLTPTSPSAAVTASIPAGAALDAAGNPNAASAVFSLPVKLAGPTVQVTSTASGATNQSQIPIAVTFSSPVNITAQALASKILVTGGTLTVAQAGTGGTSFAFILAPSGAGPADVTIQVPGAVAQDASGQGNSAAAPFSITFDNTPPSAILTSADSMGTFQSPIPVTVLFSKPVTGFTAAGLAVGNATVADFAGNGARYSFELIPIGIGQVTATVMAGSARDAAGNQNTASATFSRVFEVAPVAAIYSPAGPYTDGSDPIPIYVQFNEPVRLAPNAFSVVQGTITDAVTQLTPTTFLFHVQPVVPSGQTSTVVSVTLAQLAATDAFGNFNTSPYKYSFNYSSLAPLQATITQAAANAPYVQLQVQFSQSVTGFDASKVVVSGGGAVSGFSGGGSTYYFWVTPVPTQQDIGQTMTLNVTVPAGAATGADGRPLPAAANFTINTPTITGPTAYVTSVKTHDQWTTGPVPFEVTFSEPVNGFTSGSLAPSNSTVSNFQQDPANSARYTFDLVPQSGATSVSVGVSPGAPPNEITGRTSGKPLMGFPTALARTLASGPVVTAITSSASGVQQPGDLVQIRVTFSSPVIVNTGLGLPALILNANGPGGYAVATYVGGGSADGTSNTLVFNYVVQAGQRAARLDVQSNGALTTLGSPALVSKNITDALGNAIPAPVLLFDPGTPNSLGGGPVGIPIGAAAVGVVQVGSTLANGTYGVGTTIPITLQFNGPVTVDTTGGTPTLTLALDGGATARAAYASGSGTNTLTFNFTPTAGQTTPALDYIPTGALSFNGGQILIAGTSTSVDPTLPPPGTVGSLGQGAAIAVAGQPARVIAAWDNQTNQTLSKGSLIRIFVSFDGPVTVDTTSGTPTLTLALDGGRTATATYVGGSGTTSLEFDYTVALGDDSAKLDYIPGMALNPSGASIKDALGRNASLTLPAPGGPGSLRSNNTTVAGSPPQVVSVNALTANGGYGVGSVIFIQVTFSRPVVVGGPANSTVTLQLNSGIGAVATYNATLEPIPILTFQYTVAAGESTAQLDYRGITSLVLTGGATITDLAFSTVNADLTLPAPGSAASMAGSSSLAVQTLAITTPVAADVTSTAINGTYGVGATIPIAVTLSAPVTITNPGATGLQLALSGGQTAVAAYAGGSGTNVLTFNYTVASGQGAPLLDDGGFLVLALSSGTTNVTLPAPGAPGSLGQNNRIAIDTAAAPVPAVIGASAAVANGVYQAGNVIPILVHFSRPVIVSGTPQLAVALGGSSYVAVKYSGGSGTDTLTFDYTVASGQNSARLDYLSSGALTAPGGSTIRDAYNQQPANPTLPEPGLAGSLSQGALLVVGTPQPPLIGSGGGGGGGSTGTIATTVTLDGPSSALDGETITLKAVVASSQAGDVPGPGRVTFLAGTSVLGTATLSGGVATLSLTLPFGTYVVHAVYDGDASHAGSTSAPLSIGVGRVSVGKSGIAVVEADGSRLPLGASYKPKVLAKGLNIAEGVLATDGAPEIIAAPKPGERAPVEVINGVTGAVIARLTPFGRNYSGGIAVTAADLQGDGTSDVIAGRMRGRRTAIKAIDPLTGRTIHTMVAFRRVFHRGLSLSTRDVNGDGTPDIVAQSQGRGHRTLIETFDGRTGVQIGGIERLPAGPAARRSRRS